MAEVVQLRASERKTQPPGPPEPPMCKGLETTALAIAEIRDHMEWQAECLVLIAKALKVKLPRRPRRR